MAPKLSDLYDTLASHAGEARSASGATLPDGRSLVDGMLDARFTRSASAFADSFANSGSSRVRSGIRPRLAAADAHRDTRSLDELRAMAQHLGNNDPAAGALIERKAQLVAGELQAVRCDTGDRSFDAEAVDRFCAWMDDVSGDGCDATGQMTGEEMLAAHVRHLVTDGDLLHVFVEEGEGRGARRSVMTAEAALIRNPLGRPDGTFAVPVDPARDGGGEEAEAGAEAGAGAGGGPRTEPASIVGGHVVGEGGRTRAYLVSRWHDDGSRVDDARPEWVDADRALWIASPLGRRIGQRRSEPQLASSIDALVDLHDYTDATQQAAKLAAFIALYLKTNQSYDPATALGLKSKDKSQTASGHREIEFKSGTVQKLPPGTDLAQVDTKQPSTMYEAFYWARMRVVSARLGVPLELGFYRFDRNFAASRAAMMAAWLGVRMEQKLVRRVLNRWWRFYVGGLIRDEVIRPPSGPRVSPRAWRSPTFDLPHPPSLDLSNEVQARLMAVEAGLMSPSMATTQLGFGRFADIAEQRKKDRDAVRRLGLDPDAGGASGNDSVVGTPDGDAVDLDAADAVEDLQRRLDEMESRQNA